MNTFFQDAQKRVVGRGGRAREFIIDYSVTLLTGCGQAIAGPHHRDGLFRLQNGANVVISHRLPTKTAVFPQQVGAFQFIITMQ